jgi:DNA-directed RNA polymerase subunit beta'
VEIFAKGHLITDDDAQIIEKSGVSEVFARSPLTCKSRGGICAKCYGLDLGRNKLIDLGEAVGTVAAQAIGEPGTQLTMRTFHSGGTAQIGGDITQGLPRVEEVFEKRKPKNPAVISKVSGFVSEVTDGRKEKKIVIIPELEEKSKVKKAAAVEYEVHRLRMPLVKVGDTVKKGELLTDGSADIDDLFKYAGKEITENYIISEIKKLYELQGEAVSRKHIEVIVRQMFGRLKVKKAGDTVFAEGAIIEWSELFEENEKMKVAGLEEAKAEQIVLGITDVSLSRQSFLSAASFQHTTRVLIQSAAQGAEDRLNGLMENVILGRLIPAGTGFKGSEKSKMIENLQATYRDEIQGE